MEHNTGSSTTGNSRESPRSSSMLLCLPRELRDLIYHHVFASTDIPHIRFRCARRSWRRPLPIKGHMTNWDTLRLLCICKQIYAEAFTTAYQPTVFSLREERRLHHTSEARRRYWSRFTEAQLTNIRRLTIHGSTEHMPQDFFSVSDNLCLKELKVCMHETSAVYDHIA